jgi:hypothetical protein
MNRTAIGILIMATASLAPAADDLVGVVHGAVERIDSASKVIAIRTNEGTTCTVRIADSTAVHGFDGGKAAWRGLEKGAEIVAHGTRNGSEFTATELDHLGRGGLKMTTGAVVAMDRAGRFIVVRTASDTKETYYFSSNSAHTLAKGAGTGTKVVVYSSEDAGKKVAHFLEPLA